MLSLFLSILLSLSLSLSSLHLFPIWQMCTATERRWDQLMNSIWIKQWRTAHNGTKTRFAKLSPNASCRQPNTNNQPASKDSLQSPRANGFWWNFIKRNCGIAPDLPETRDDDTEASSRSSHGGKKQSANRNNLLIAWQTYWYIYWYWYWYLYLYWLVRRNII